MERCRACKIQGGHEEACAPDHFITQRIKVEGRPCAYVEQEPGNALASGLLEFLLYEPLRPLAERAFDAATADLLPHERAELVDRIRRALADPRVAEKLYPSKRK